MHVGCCCSSVDVSERNSIAITLNIHLSEFARRCLLGFRLDLGAAQI